MRLLIIEANRNVANLVERKLRKAGHDVAVASSGEPGADLAGLLHYDIILLDKGLASRTSCQLVKDVRKSAPDVPVLLLAPCDAVDDVIRALDAGADDYLCTPFRFDDLLSRMQALIRRRARERLGVLRYGPIVLDRLNRVIQVDQLTLGLTPREFRLLEGFLAQPRTSGSPLPTPGTGLQVGRRSGEQRGGCARGTRASQVGHCLPRAAD